MSDGNLHPNVLPKNLEQMEIIEDIFYDLGKFSISLGGSPMAEHGVGRNRVKKKLMKILHGESAVSKMKEIRRAIDPQNTLSPGVLI